MSASSKLYRSKIARSLLGQSLKDYIELAHSPSGALNTRGWSKSRKEKLPVNSDSKPIAWYTYAALSFLQNRIPSGSDVFEYGMGYSTIWWSERVRSVTSVEHDEAWFRKLSEDLPDNAKAILHEVATESYSSAVKEHGVVYDIIVVDGRRRIDCLSHVLPALASGGVIVFDNSEREKYRPGIEAFKAENEFRELDFSGMGPVTAVEWTTSIFYRDGNCLGI